MGKTVKGPPLVPSVPNGLALGEEEASEREVVD